MFDWMLLVPTEGLNWLQDMIEECPDHLLRFQHYTTNRDRLITRCDPIALCFLHDFPAPMAMDMLLEKLGDVSEFCQAWSTNQITLATLLGNVRFELDRRANTPKQMKETFWNSLPDQGGPTGIDQLIAMEDTRVAA